MKKFVVLTLVFALLALAVTPVFAQGGSGKGKNMNGGGGDQLQYNYAYAGEEIFSVAGVVTAVATTTDPLTGVTTGSVTLDVVAGNHLLHDTVLAMDLPSITVVITETTRIVQTCNSTEVDCKLAATLAVGQNVTIKGLTDGTTYTAQHITIGAALTGTLLQSPQLQNHTGQPEDAGAGAARP
jgi:hypothetical protein